MVCLVICVCLKAFRGPRGSLSEVHVEAFRSQRTNTNKQLTHTGRKSEMSNQLVPNPIIGSPASAPPPLPPLPPSTTNQAAAVAPASVGTGHGAHPPASAGAAPKPTNPQQRALQQQIQAQLQSQLQAQLQAAASRGKQANITPEMIQVRSGVRTRPTNHQGDNTFSARCAPI